MRVWLLLLLGCGGGTLGVVGTGAPTTTDSEVTAPVQPSNVLFIFMDDVGNDKIGTYGEHPTAPPTPTLDRLADEGVLFRNAYASPICGPSRAGLLSGRRSLRTGGGENLQGPFVAEFDTNELLIPEMLRQAPVPWQSAAVGKWHMAHPDVPDPLTHPQRSGFDSFQGTFSNLLQAFDPNNRPTNYNHWEYLDNGVVSVLDEYATSAMVDRALERAHAMEEPWFLYLPVQAAHDPWTAPPAELLQAPLGPAPTDTERYNAIVRVLDAEIGRLLTSLDPELLARTTVVVMGDNGTPGDVIEPPRIQGQGKLTLYEGGVNVPLIVWSPLIVEPGREVDDLVDVHDWFPTLAELAGVPTDGLTREDGSPATLDGVSLLPLLTDPAASLNREALMVDRFGPPGGGPYENTQRAVIERDWKYVELHLQSGEYTALFDLRGRFDDGPNLLNEPLSAEAQTARDRLALRMAAFEATPYEGP